MEYIIVQAGGKGTRLEYLTANKPKALVPVNNLPMLFHLFRKYPDKRYIIIADYKKEVLHEYLACFAEVKYQIVDADGTGTCAGIRQALELIPDRKAFMLVWSDLILPEGFQLPEGYQAEKTVTGDGVPGDIPADADFIGISSTFPCRWSYQNGEFKEERSTEHGVAGFFLFTDKKKLENVPESGELVRWMQEERHTYQEISLAGTREFGLLSEYEQLNREKCRPFNKITFCDGKVIKEGIDEQGRKLAGRERSWYQKAMRHNSSLLPEIYGMDPLVMERIEGKNIYEYDLTYEEKKKILVRLIDSLKELHGMETVPVDSFSNKEAYFNKTFARINKVRDLIPFAEDKELCINGKTCRNVFFHKREVEQLLNKIPCEEFCFIHGDCTFSNMMLRKNGDPVLIDPRGYFGYTELYGDPLYDWAKLYYSIVGNYDRFNLKEFRLAIDEKQREVRLVIDSNHWEDMEDDFFTLTKTDRHSIRVLHAIIWLSLSTYAWQDYDSICGAFYNGLYYLEDALG